MVTNHLLYCDSLRTVQYLTDVEEEVGVHAGDGVVVDGRGVAEDGCLDLHRQVRD